METNYHKTPAVRELGETDPLALVQILPQLIKHWDNESDYALNGNKNLSLSQVQHINFRWSDKKKDPVEYIDLPLWTQFKALLLPIMRTVVEPIGYKKGYFPRVMLAKMHPGTVIPEHIDGKTRGWIAHKIHVPVVTSDKALFFVDGETYHFEKGKSYEVNNGALHGARNDGGTARIHLIFEYLDAEINTVPGSDI